MVKHKHGKSYTPLVLPVFVELGMEQYHSLHKNLKYWGLVQKMFASNERVKLVLCCNWLTGGVSFLDSWQI